MKATGKSRDEVVAEPFKDTVGVGSYRIDLHPSSGGDNYIDVSSLPFQIPLGALIPRRVENLIPACKNLGVTHITNGCYRLHPVEWNIGEAAGLLAAVALESGRTPAAIHGDPASLRAFQDRLLAAGVPLAWLIDVGTGDPAFAVTQTLFRDGKLTAPDSLAVGLDQPLTSAEWRAWGGQGPLPATRGEGLRRLAGT